MQLEASSAIALPAATPSAHRPALTERLPTAGRSVAAAGAELPRRGREAAGEGRGHANRSRGGGRERSGTLHRGPLGPARGRSGSGSGSGAVRGGGRRRGGGAGVGLGAGCASVRCPGRARVYRFSAFWLRSSVVSVLISLISDTSSMRGLYIKRIFGRGSWTRSLLPPLRASSRYGSTSGHGAPPPGGMWRGERREGRRGGGVGRAGGGWRCVPRGGAVGCAARRGAAFGCAERRQRSAALRCARRSDRGGGGVGGGRSR